MKSYNNYDDSQELGKDFNAQPIRQQQIPTPIFNTSSTMNTSSRILVTVRMRPLLRNEVPSDLLSIHSDSNTVSVRYKQKDTETIYAFDHVFAPEASQSSVYHTMVGQMVEEIPYGINACIIAYGQTGAGKTYTLSELGNGEACGILPRAISDIFNIMESEKIRFDYNVKISYLQIYNETIQDLLQPENVNLPIREDKGKIYVEGLSYHRVRNLNDVLLLLEHGSRTRAVAHTKMNRVSSRSHCLFEMMVKRRDKVNGKIFTSKFTCCDLAGSERAHKTQAEGLHFEEAKFINRSLSALGNVISILSQDDKSKIQFVPWRDSKLTRVLQDTIGGNSRVSLIVNIAPDVQSYNESVTSLQFGQRAMNVSVKPKVNSKPINYKQLANNLQKRLDEIQGTSMNDLVIKNNSLVDEATSILHDLESMTNALAEVRTEKDKYHAWYMESADRNLELVGDLQKANGTIKQLDKIISLVVSSSHLSGIDASKVMKMRNEVMNKPFAATPTDQIPQNVEQEHAEVTVPESILTKQKRQNELLRRQNELQIDALKKLVEEREAYKYKLEAMTRQQEILSLQVKKMDDNNNSINATVAEIKRQKKKQGKILSTYQKRIKELDELNDGFITDLRQLDKILCALQKNNIISISDDNDSVIFLKDANNHFRTDAVQVSHLEQAFAQLLQQIVEREKLIELMIQQRKLFTVSTHRGLLNQEDSNLFSATASSSFQFGSIRNMGKFQRWDRIFEALNDLKKLVPNSFFNSIHDGQRNIKTLNTSANSQSFIYLDDKISQATEPTVVDFDNDQDKFDQATMVEQQNEDPFSKELRMINFKYQTLNETLQQVTEKYEDMERQYNDTLEENERLKQSAQVLTKDLTFLVNQQKLGMNEVEKIQNYCERLEERFQIVQRTNESFLQEEEKYSLLNCTIERVRDMLAQELGVAVQKSNDIDPLTKYVHKMVISSTGSGTTIAALEENVRSIEKIIPMASRLIQSGKKAQTPKYSTATQYEGEPKYNAATQYEIWEEHEEEKVDTEELFAKIEQLELQLKELREEKRAIAWNAVKPNHKQKPEEPVKQPTDITSPRQEPSKQVDLSLKLDQVRQETPQKELGRSQVRNVSTVPVIPPLELNIHSKQPELIIGLQKPVSKIEKKQPPQQSTPTAENLERSLSPSTKPLDLSSEVTIQPLLLSPRESDSSDIKQLRKSLKIPAKQEENPVPFSCLESPRRKLETPTKPRNNDLPQPAQNTAFLAVPTIMPEQTLRIESPRALSVEEASKPSSVKLLRKTSQTISESPSDSAQM